MSQPTRAAWIEIVDKGITVPSLVGRSPLGLRGLKCKACNRFSSALIASQPTRAAWIEIPLRVGLSTKIRSQPTRAAWIEIKNH